MRFTPDALVADIVLNDAVWGVQHLMQLGTISYLTARYSMSDQWQNGIAQGTQTWLEEHRFVNPCNVVYCNKIEGKLRYLLGVARESQERLVVIDDSYARILELVAAEVQGYLPGKMCVTRKNSIPNPRNGATSVMRRHPRPGARPYCAWVSNACMSLKIFTINPGKYPSQ